MQLRCGPISPDALPLDHAAVEQPAHDALAAPVALAQAMPPRRSQMERVASQATASLTSHREEPEVRPGLVEFGPRHLIRLSVSLWQVHNSLPQDAETKDQVWLVASSEKEARRSVALYHEPDALDPEKWFCRHADGGKTITVYVGEGA